MYHILVFAIHASNSQVSDCVSKCLARARHVYPEALIIAVDNKSVVTDWKNNPSVVCIENVSEYGYELGAYRTAIEYLTSVSEKTGELPVATYLFLQGTVWINAIINMDHSVANIKPFRHYNDRYELYNKQDHALVLQNILTILEKFPDFNWKWDTYDTLCVSMMFVTNKLGLIRMEADNILNIKCITKQDSYAVERIVGQYIKVTTGSIVGLDTTGVVHRTYQNHISNPDWEKNINETSVIHKIFCDQL